MLDLGPDAPIVENKQGGRQSACPVSLVESFPHRAVLRVGEVVKRGADRYAPDNWRKIPHKDHLNHALAHLFAYCAGDTQDDHLGHAACRVLFALETTDDVNADSEKANVAAFGGSRLPAETAG